MVELESIVSVEHTNVYRVSLKSVVWVTLAIIVIMSLLYPLVQMPPIFGGFNVDMYFHSIGIGIAALASCLVISVFKLDKYEPPIDFPIHYRAFVAVILGAISGLFYVIPGLNNALPDVSVMILIVALILLADVGGALFFEMFELPRKLNGTFSDSNYFSLMFATSGKDWGSYKKMGVTYWLTLFAIGSTLIAGLIGFLNLLVMFLGSSFLTGYINMINYGGASGFLDATLDPHSHMMALALMGGIVAIVAEHFKENALTDWKRVVVKIGLWISFIGVCAMTIILAYCAFGNYNPFTLFASGQANGIAGDDSMMAIVGIGALVALVPLALTKMEKSGKESWKDPIRFTILATWLGALILNIVEGFYIELNEDTFANSLAANDAAYSTLQPMFGIFFLTATSLFLLAADFYQFDKTFKDVIGWLALIGLVISVVGASLWIFVDPTVGSIEYMIWIAGILIVVASAIITVVNIFLVKSTSYKRTITERVSQEKMDRVAGD